MGIDDDGRIIGVDKQCIQNMKRDFANLCNNEQKINPTIYLNIKDYLINDKTILHIYEMKVLVFTGQMEKYLIEMKMETMK